MSAQDFPRNKFIHKLAVAALKVGTFWQDSLLTAGYAYLGNADLKPWILTFLPIRYQCVSSAYEIHAGCVQNNVLRMVSRPIGSEASGGA